MLPIRASNDNITPPKEYIPSNKIISDFTVHPHAIPNTAKNNVPNVDILSK